MLNDVRIALLPAQFGDAERVIVRHAGLTATAFCYRSGVAALRLAHDGGHLTLLPFHGQQIWEATILGRPLAMRSMFDEPRDTTDYLANYGAFFIHCGMTAMGNPAPADRHPLHGELPNAHYDEAELLAGIEDGVPFLELTGASRQTVAFSHDYVARPHVRFHEGASVIDACIAVENRRNAPLDLIYLGHVNFLPVDGGTLVDTVADDQRDIVLRRKPDDVPAAGTFRGEVFADVAAHRRFPPDTLVEPELVLSMRAAAGRDGWAHAMQLHPDGSADLVSHRPDELPYAVRWMVRSRDEDALGLVLPATAPPDGLAAARAAGHLVRVPPSGAWSARMRFGALAPAAADRMQAAIAAIRSRP